MTDPWEQRLARMRRLLPVPLLAVSTVGAAFATWSEGDGSGWRVAGPLAVAALLWWAVVVPRLRPSAGVVLAGHVVLAAALVAVYLPFGVFAYVGFLHSYPLDRRWRPIGFGATSLVVAASLAGGYPTPGDPQRAAGYLLIAVVLLGLVWNSASITHHAVAQNRENVRLHAELVEQARVAGVADERRRLAGEIHDTLAQDLTGVVTHLEAAEHHAAEPAVWRRHVGAARDLARAGLVEARRSVQALRPEQLEQHDLAAAISGWATAWGDQHGVRTQLDLGEEPLVVDAPTEDALFRVAQEALTNVAKHAGAGVVRVTLTCAEDALLLDVVDDGKGFVPDAAATGYGLVGMGQRLAEVGGTLTVQSEPGAGTSLNATVPLP